MVRAALVLCVFVSSVAIAAPAPWTLPPLPADWKDITEEAMKDPAMEAQRQTILKAGGTFEGKMYAGDNGGILVFTSGFTGASAVVEELNAFMNGARNSALKSSKELEWKVDPTPTMLVGTQRRDQNGQAITAKMYVGFTDGDDLRAVSFICYGEDAVCAPLLAKVTVDTAGLQQLSELDANKKKLTPRRIGWLVGGLATGIFILAALWKRRPRVPK